MLVSDLRQQNFEALTRPDNSVDKLAHAFRDIIELYVVSQAMSVK